MVNVHNIASRLNATSKHLPINKIELEDALDTLIHRVLFPICDHERTVEKSLYLFYSVLVENLTALLDRERAEAIIDTFLEKLPKLQDRLYKEAEVYYLNDPAARSVEEVMITYPGFFAMTVYRISHEFYKQGTPIIPRLFSEYAHSKVGIDINPGAVIGDSFYIDHGTGIVIGETTIIGNNVKIYQGVTLGALFVTKGLFNEKRHPTIEDNVVIYAGATILGGKTVVGHDSLIGGNAWLTKSVVPYSQVMQNAEIRIRSALHGGEAADFSI
ncbi:MULTISPECIES: serine O-acetyltransferase EpsC [unclassified Dysgonomonas]|uniref:serine O-acetyltransferase EpsC n=1 Tax=unclassified Dysgonomonas TaxID=2630389 RepID=UPI0013EAF9A0|nr:MULTISPECIES: serine O-acetyltransferase EpsC [unclassified Dysgonomonas]